MTTSSLILPSYDVIIAGAGPGGSATAIELARLAPYLVARTLLIDKAEFPRHKLCAGGLTGDARRLLRDLGLCSYVPNAVAESLSLTLPLGSHSITFRHKLHLVTVNRLDLDYALLNIALDRGFAMHQRERLTGLRYVRDGLQVVTSNGTYHAKVLVAADGANSKVHSLLGERRHRSNMLAIEALARIPEKPHNSAVINFIRRPAHYAGYSWVFPRPSIDNDLYTVGLAVTRLPPRGVAFLARSELINHGLKMGYDISGSESHGFPVPVFTGDRSKSLPRVVFVGDAAGTDSLWGEGITSALALGRLAASAIKTAFDRDEFSMKNYESQVRKSRAGRRLTLRNWVAKSVYDCEGTVPVPLLADLAWSKFGL